MGKFVYVIFAVFISFNSIHAQVTGLSGWNIFLDPGHSRKENMGIHNYSEAERNLRVALRLRDVLLKTTDIDTVYLSRTNDQQSVSLSQRTDKANTLGADWFHSIHSNASSSPDHNSTLLLWGQYYNGNEKVPNGGRAMADIMVDLLSMGMRIGTSGSIGDCSFYTWSDWCKTSGGPYLHVNRVSLMPSELSESGFHTNPRQNHLFMNDDWKKLEAMTFYWSILEFHGIQRPFVGIVTGIISDEETNIPINGAKVSINDQTYVTDTYESLFKNYSDDPELLHNGFYYIESLPDDTLELIVEHERYYPDTVSIVVQDNFFTFKDVQLLSNEPPQIVSTSPAQNFDRFPAWESIIIKFSRNMNTVSVEDNFSIQPELDGEIRWTENNSKLIFRTDSMKFETEYTLTISEAAIDIYGKSLDGNGDGIGGDVFVLTFKTGPEDLTPPKLTMSYPANLMTNVELQPIINYTFDELLDTTTIVDGIFQLKTIDNQKEISGVLKHYLFKNRSILCFFPTEKLNSGSRYQSILNPGLKDISGNGMTTSRIFRFTTGYTWNDIKLVDNFDAGLHNWILPQNSGDTKGIVSDSTHLLENEKIVNILTNSSKSMEINYAWDEEANTWLLCEALQSGAPSEVTFDKNATMQIYVFGDGSGIQFRFAVDDNIPNVSADNHEVSPWFAIDWLGWKLIEWDLVNDGTGTWDNVGDGNLDGILRVNSIQLTYNTGSSASGTLYFDDLQLVNKVKVGVEERRSVLPENFALFQNFPNPFSAKSDHAYIGSSTSTIKFALAKQSTVTLKLYDVMGHEIQTITNQEFPAGVHTVVLNANNLNSGVYFYRLETEYFSETKKLILVQ